jgi:ribosomal protein L3 glutamine methyltransferase
LIAHRHSLAGDTQAEVLAEFCTVQDLLRWGFSQFQRAKLFYGHGTDNGWDEIIYLVLATLKLGPRLHSQWLAARLTREERVQIIQLIKKRIEERLPTAYLVNEAWFAGLSFYVDPRVLIPRSPLAELIQRQFSPWVAAYNVDSILDLGTGSACIAIACAYAFPHARIDAVDYSAEALEVAAINVAQHKLDQQVTLIQSDGFKKLAGRHYDIIVSNPPYVDQEDFAQLPAEYQHEPALALTGGTDGLDFIVHILTDAKSFLRKDGLLVVEVGNSKSALVARFPQLPFIWLEFEHSDAEVFILTKEQLVNDGKEI